MRTTILLLAIALAATTVAAVPTASAGEPICNEQDYPEFCAAYYFTWDMIRCITRQAPCPQ